MSVFKKIIQGGLRRIGLQVRRFPDLDLRRRMQMVKQTGINVLLDVGANEGQYGLIMRKLGYTGRIISFEPLYEPYERLQRATVSHGPWVVVQTALGAGKGTMPIHVTAQSASSSLLEPVPELSRWAPEANIISHAEVLVQRLDDIYDLYCASDDQVMLKLDVQGYEHNVLVGAERTLPRIRLVQMEMSIRMMYAGEHLFAGMLEFMADRGFQLVSLENGFFDKESGHLLQVDGVFLNTK